MVFKISKGPVDTHNGPHYQDMYSLVLFGYG